MSTIVTLKASDSEACMGWHCRLSDLGKGYRISERHLPFGRTAVCIKRDGVGLILKQGGSTAVRTVIEAPSAAQQAIIDDLRQIGMLANAEVR